MLCLSEWRRWGQHVTYEKDGLGKEGKQPDQRVDSYSVLLCDSSISGLDRRSVESVIMHIQGISRLIKTSNSRGIPLTIQRRYDLAIFLQHVVLSGPVVAYYSWQYCNPPCIDGVSVTIRSIQQSLQYASQYIESSINTIPSS